MKMLKLVILLSLLSLATSSSSESFFSSLQNLHNHLKLLPKQLESVHLEYQLQSNTLTPLQLFEKVYNVKIDKKSIEKVGGAKDEVLDLIRKIRKSDSSEEEQNEILEALGKMEETRGDVRKVLEEKLEKWKTKLDDTKVDSLVKSIEAQISDLNKMRFIIETEVMKASSNSTGAISLEQLAEYFLASSSALMMVTRETAERLPSLETDDTLKIFDDEIRYFHSKLEGFRKLISLKNLKLDYGNLELIGRSEAGKEMKMVSEVAAQFNEDYEKFQFLGYSGDIPKMDLLKEFRFKTHGIYLRNQGDFDDLVKLSDFLERLRSSGANLTHIDKVQHCLDDAPPLISNSRRFGEINNAVADLPGIPKELLKMDREFEILRISSDEFHAHCAKAKDSNDFDDVKSSWKKLSRITEDLVINNDDFRKNVQKVSLISISVHIFFYFVRDNYESFLKLTDCLITLNSTIPNIKQSIDNIKLFNTTENLKIMEKSVKTLDSLRDLHKLIEDFEAQKLTDRTEKLPEIQEPIDKINTLKTGIDAIGSVLNAHRISKNMLRDSDVFEKFPDSDSYKSSESRIREFFSRFVPTTSSVISTISAVPDAPEFRISSEFVKFATENTVVDVETLMDFEKNWTDLRAKIEKMGRVLKEFEVWVRDGPVIGTTHGTTLAPRGRYGEVSCDCEMIDIDNSCDGFCDIDWEI